MLELSFFVYLLRISTIGITPSLLSTSIVVVFVVSTSYTALLKVITPANRRYITFKKIILSQLALLVVLFVSVFIALLNGFSWTESVTTLLKILILFSCMNVGLISGYSEKRKRMLKFVIYSLFIHVLLGILLFPFGFTSEVHGVQRVVGLAGGVQIYANLVSALFIISFFMLHYKLEVISRSVLLIFLGVSFVAFLFSNTLKNFIMAIAVVAIPFIWDKRKVIPFSVVIVFFFLPLIFLFREYIVETSLYQRLHLVYEAGLSTTLAQGEKLESSLVWRLLHWNRLFSDWYDNYLFWGSGIGQTVNMNGLKTANGDGFEAHSDFVTFIVEFGLFLTPIVALLLLYPLKLLMNISINSTYAKVFGYFVLGSFISSMFGNVFYSLSNLYYLWFFVGWSLAYYECKNRLCNI
ncbi:hypothetical protein [Vibrio navarrensis]|uniref:hypothetical protein n=1 Tax=Vibrio navarrensis TaxID=29495 RepID=UPI001558FDD4|nr:hypothetical protein [Vibrio navarrensis]